MKKIMEGKTTIHLFLSYLKLPSKVELEYFEEDTHPDKLFPRVRFEIFLTRKFTYFLINIISPALFVIVIALTVFWLPPESGEKVSLGITVLLALEV